MVFPNISISVMECFKVPIVYVIQTKGALNSSFPSISQNITMNRYTKNARYRISFLYNFNCNNINTIVRTTPRSHPVVLNIIIILGINRVNAVKTAAAKTGYKNSDYSYFILFTSIVPYNARKITPPDFFISLPTI